VSAQSALIASVRLILADPAADVRWYDRTSEWVNDTAHIEIVPLSVPRYGVDEQRLASIDASTSVQETIYGNRSLRLQFTVNRNDQDLADSAVDLADVLVAGFARYDVSLLLEAEHVGIPRCGPVRAISAPDAHGDIRSIAVFEAVFPWSRVHTGGIIPTIGSVEWSGEVEGSASGDPITVGRVTAES
jgi:hypothetical protein